MSNTILEKDIENQQIQIRSLENKFVQTNNELSFEQMESLLCTTYDTSQNNNSTICDVIAIYLKGQKILYTEAKTLCEQRLTSLMLNTDSFISLIN
jgi:hypothetical protein